MTGKKYEVEVVKEARRTRLNKWEYLTKWFGYEDDENTWQTEYSLQSHCSRLLESFWNHVGDGNYDFACTGRIIKADPEWIAKEQNYFRDTYIHKTHERLTIRIPARPLVVHQEHKQVPSPHESTSHRRDDKIPSTARSADAPGSLPETPRVSRGPTTQTLPTFSPNDQSEQHSKSKYSGLKFYKSGSADSIFLGGYDPHASISKDVGDALFATATDSTMTSALYDDGSSYPVTDNDFEDDFLAEAFRLDEADSEGPFIDDIWNGDLFVKVGGRELFCQCIKVSPNSPADNDERIRTALRSLSDISGTSDHEKRHISLDGFYLASDLKSILTGRLVGLINPSTISTQDCLQKLQGCMTKYSLVSLLQVLAPSVETQYLLFFPPSLKGLCGKFHLSPVSIHDSTLMVILLSAAIPEFGGIRRFDCLVGEVLLPISDWTAFYSRDAVSILGVPEWLLTFLADCRSYAIWPAVGSEQSLQTSLLRSIIRKYSFATESNWHSAVVHEAGIIFVHIGFLRRLRESFVVARMNEATIVQYGSDETVHCYNWGMKKLYHSGGLVTFTASTLLDHPLHVFNLLESVERRLEWDLYVIPSVLERAINTHYKDRKQALAAYDMGDFVFERILNAIQERTLMFASISSPPDDHPPVDLTDWNFLSVGPCTAREILEYCTTDMTEYVNLEETALLDKDIIPDLEGMATEPGIANKYRRYIVLTSESKKHDSLMVECIPITKFIFENAPSTVIKRPFTQVATSL
ncbi:uncharacterized protein BT62DRAFT_502243 [Guyanagaster necrorhizus]|uniref:Chromo domain-containing protein n=1 Tax=Guyanagaster necrorhizus TaxID=856835 RepID=A0A9P7W1J9_9AGAR|nr:uncharacterized protein BT62DRAFT_502243 [Guyanagaster necrorhizus MCA 3950]KAG7450284.1 hypothetical protein BT62DRAFT_502243 [Guyanagaster necrorhizus MCA 3950]